LKTLLRAERLLIGEDIKDVEFSWPIGMPLCRSLGHGLWEMRTALQNRSARVFFCIYEEQMVLLHGILKKTQKTPRADLIWLGAGSANWREQNEKEPTHRLHL
jgi:phage-related protein